MGDEDEEEVRFSFRLTKSLHEKYVALSKKHRRSLNAELNIALEEALDARKQSASEESPRVGKRGA